MDNEIVALVENIKAKKNYNLNLLGSSLKLSEYLYIFSEVMEYSKKEGLDDQAEYCAMYILAMAELASKGLKRHKNIVIDDFKINKELYDEALELSLNNTKRYKHFVLKNLLTSILIIVILFVVLFAILKANIWFTVIFCAIVLIADLFFNYLSNAKRYQKKLADSYLKSVNSLLIKINSKFI